MAKKRKKRKTAAKSGFKISYEASILTLITFAISITSLGWQTVNYFAGAKVRLIPPDQITIGSSPTVTYPPRDGGPFVHFIARMGYVNEASAGYNATVRAERVRVRAAGQRAFESRWYFFVISDAVGAKNDELQVKKEKSAQPFPLAAGSSASHETLFQPWPKDCAGAPASPPCNARDDYVDWATFTGWLRRNHVIEFEFLADVFGRTEPVSAKCRVEMPAQRFQEMLVRQWASPVCTPL